MFLRCILPCRHLRLNGPAMLAVFTLFAAPALAQLSPALASSVTSLGQAAASTPVAGTVWLPLHNKAQLDAQVAAMYTPGSPTFQQFATPDALKQFAPTEAELAAVREELVSHGLVVTAANNFSLRFEGTAAAFEGAFHTVLNRYRAPNGPILNAPATAPSLRGSAAGLLGAVTGLSGATLHPLSRRQADPATGSPLGMAPAGFGAPGLFSSRCLGASQTVTDTYQYGTSVNGAVRQTWTGLIYGGTLPGGAFPPGGGVTAACAYAPQDVYGFYGLETAYKGGYNGAGETIAIVDAYGSPSMEDDFASFNYLYGLPPATAASFQTIQPTPFPASGLNNAEELAWAEEATMDVEWTHAIAPGAAIRLVTAPTGKDDDLQQAVLYVVQNHLAGVIAGSFGNDESLMDGPTLTTWDQICELAAYQGIAANFGTGDGGAFGSTVPSSTGSAPGTPAARADVSTPASSPYATAVGGTSIAYSPLDGSVLQTGWGTHVVQLSTPNGVPALVSESGSAGGVSSHFSKPGYQSMLPGAGRLLPDVSALADPLTGVETLFTVNGRQTFIVEGGTSLANVLFSAEWALIEQRFGYSLGQAAPYLARFGGNSVITDLVAPPPVYAVQGTVQINSNAPVSYTSEALVAPVTGGFASALYRAPGGGLYAISFGTDEPAQPLVPSLAPPMVMSQGWDPVTGWGSIDMGALFSAFSRSAGK